MAFIVILITLFILICAPRALGGSKTHANTASFDSASLSFSSSAVKVALDFNVTFRTTRTIFGAREDIVVRLPRFTRSIGENSTDTIAHTYDNITYGDLIIAPSYNYEAFWLEGPNEITDTSGSILPFRTSELHIRMKRNHSIEARAQETITVFKENGIGAFCGFPSSDTLNSSRKLIAPANPAFEILTVQSLFFYRNESDPELIDLGINGTLRNFTAYQNDTYFIDFYPGIGGGCSGALADCNLHGECDYCFEQCRCFDGFGSDADTVIVGRDLQPDCSTRVCPAGKAVADFPTASDRAHGLAECGNHGLCDRDTGQCKCIPPYTGAACDRMACPNDCSGHGTCVSMGELSRRRVLENPSQVDFEYGTSTNMFTSAWDHDVIYLCVCDSTWDTGYFAGQTQLAEFFGPDCSQRRCPSGDDPYTSVDETNCNRVSQLNFQYGVLDAEVGERDNNCYVPCSNRGVCNTKSGTCDCFPGSWGQACERIAGAGRGTWESGAEADSFWLSVVNDSIIVEGN